MSARVVGSNGHAALCCAVDSCSSQPKVFWLLRCGAVQLPMRHAPLPPPSPPAACRWVPADPLTGFVDRAREVEANLPKERQPVAYAVALAGGGAKDVTSRRVLPCR